MKQYGEVAVRAARTLAGSSVDSADAWDSAARIVIRSSESSRRKGCPRGAFLGLAYAGAIQGVNRPFAEDGGSNGLYARKAWQALQANPELAADADGLWQVARVQDGPESENGQIDVTLALWHEGLLRRG